jgi:hypothetical protein
MKTQNITLKTVLAVFVVFFGMSAIVFIDIPEIVLGALIGFISAILQYFFGSSTGSAAKDKVIQEIQNK